MVPFPRVGPKSSDLHKGTIARRFPLRLVKRCLYYLFSPPDCPGHKGVHGPPSIRIYHPPCRNWPPLVRVPAMHLAKFLLFFFPRPNVSSVSLSSSKRPSFEQLHPSPRPKGIDHFFPPAAPLNRRHSPSFSPFDPGRYPLNKCLWKALLRKPSKWY